MVAITTSIVRKKYLSKSITWHQVIILWCFEKDIKTFIFAQNLEDIFGVIHQRIKNGIP